jgi:hemerythrin superfamily protein
MMKSLAEQSLNELGGRLSVLSRQKSDHIKLDKLLHRLEEVEPSEQPPVLLQIYGLVFPHAFAEETVLWPTIRRLLPEGHELTLRVEQEHQAINELVTRLELLEPCSIQRQQLLNQIVRLLQEDVRDEEDELLPRLQVKLSATQLRLLGIAWEAVQLIAPTRAHPIVSRRPPGNVLAALPLSILDRSRDGVDRLLHGGAGAAAAPLKALSSMLAGASHAVERLPGMKRGEDPATRTERKSGFGWGAAALVTLASASAMMALATRRRRLAGAAGGAHASG